MAITTLRSLFVTMGMLVLVVSVPSGFAPGQGVAGRQVGNYREKPLEVFLPMADGLGVERVLRNLTTASGVRFGLERVVDDPLPDRVRWLPRSPTRVRLTGMTLGDALDWLTVNAPPLRSAAGGSELRFRWVQTGDLVHVSQVTGQLSFLDQKIDSFEVRDANLPEAISALHRRFDTGYPIRPIDVSRQPGLRERPPHELASLTKRFSLSMSNVTARDVLTAAARASGDASWIVRYNTPQAAYAGVQIAVATPGGVTHITRARD